MGQIQNNQEYNKILGSHVEVKGNFNQSVTQIFSGSELSEMLPLSAESRKFHSNAVRQLETTRKICSMSDVELAKELTSHILNRFRKSKKNNNAQLIEFEEYLVFWIENIFYDCDKSEKLTFISIRDNPHDSFHERRILIDVEEYLYYNKDKRNELIDCLINLEGF